MSDPFDEELRRSLRTRAEQLPRRPDLSRAAIAQAKGIRRRRRVAGAVAAAALVAVAVPVGLRVGDVLPGGGDEPVAEPTPTGPVNVKVNLRNLPQGDPPEVPYVEDGTVVRGDERIEISGPASAFAPAHGGVYVAANTSWRLTFYADDGGSTDLGPVTAEPVASADGEWAAWATSRGDSTSLVLRDAAGEESSIELDGAEPYSVRVHTIIDGTAYFTYDLRRNGRGVPLHTWSSGDRAAEPVDGDIQATAVSRDGNLVARLELVDDMRSCAAVIDRSTGTETRELCGTYLSIKGFSPDGRYAWADDSEGLGASRIVVLDTETGDVVRRFGSTPQLTFMTSLFEDERTLLIQADQSQRRSALVRCDVVTGDCELAGPLADGTVESPAGPPYLLPNVR